MYYFSPMYNVSTWVVIQIYCDNIVGVAWVYWIIYSRGVVQYIQRREAPRDISFNPEGVYYPMYTPDSTKKNVLLSSEYIGQCTHLTVLKTAKRGILRFQPTRYQRIFCSTHCSDLFFT